MIKFYKLSAAKRNINAMFFLCQFIGLGRIFKAKHVKGRINHDIIGPCSKVGESNPGPVGCESFALTDQGPIL